MNRLCQALLFAAALITVFHGTAFADQISEADRVVLVDFDTVDVDDAVMDQFYGNLRNIIADEDSLGLEGDGDFSMDDLWLMAGCSSTEPDCLNLLRDFVDGEHLLFGSVEYSDGVHSFTLTLYDFEAGETARQLSEETIRGDDEWLAEAIPGVLEHFVYGETGSVAVDVVGAPEAEIAIDGDVVGSGSVSVDNIAPGEATVTATTDDDAKEQRVIVRHQETADVEFAFEPAIADIEDPDFDKPSLIPGLAAVGVGVVGLGVGLVGQTQLSSTRDQVDSRVQDGVFDGTAQEAQDFQSDMDSANTMRYVGLTGGVLGLATGGALLFRALTAEPAGDDMAMGRSLDVDVGASSDGVNAGFRFDF